MGGILEAIVNRYVLRCLFRLCFKDQIRALDPNDDPLFRLQFIARLGIQYDLADVTAVLTTPAVVQFFIWRDGLFTLESSGILILPCHMHWVWARFGLLLLIKPFFGYIAKLILIRAMRKTLLGKSTIHGTSAIAARLRSEARLKVGKSCAVEEGLKLTEEQLMAVGEDLTLNGLNFSPLRRKQLKKWRFFCCVAVLQLFAAFPVHVTAPVDPSHTLQVTPELLSMVSTKSVVNVPGRSSWVYVPVGVTLALDPILDKAWNETCCNTRSVNVTTCTR